MEHLVEAGHGPLQSPVSGYLFGVEAFDDRDLRHSRYDVELEDPTDHRLLVIRPMDKNGPAALKRLALAFFAIGDRSALFVNDAPAQTIPRSTSHPEAFAGDPPLGGCHLGRKLTAILGSHGSLEAFDECRA